MVLFVQVEFTRGLVVLVMEKLLADIPELLYDDQLFSHMVDEALAFDKELRSCYGYPIGQPGVLHVLTQDEPFDKWILIERKCRCIKCYEEYQLLIVAIEVKLLNKSNPHFC